MNVETKSRPVHEAESPGCSSDPTRKAMAVALAISLVFVFLTRLPVARPWPMDTDEIGFLEQIQAHWFPMHHTLFMTAGRMMSMLTGDAYRGLLILDMLMSALALVSLWWWLRVLVAPPAAAAGVLVVAVAPIFWGYGAIAGNYTAILAVGAFLLGVACRTWAHPQTWHPDAAAIVLALGTGYRPDIGTLWLPVFLVILWKHRWRPAFRSSLIFIALNLAWLVPMLHEAGGWSRYRAQTRDFAYHAGYLNSIWNLGVMNAPVRYAVKLGMALLWTLGPCLLFVPRGIRRLVGRENGRFVLLILFLSVIPALASHMLVHFGVPGYAFHYVPALLALSVLGIGSREPQITETAQFRGMSTWFSTTASRLAVAAALLAALFLLYPTDYHRAGWRGSFDLSFARLTRVGLRTPAENRQPTLWRTANSPAAVESSVRRR